MAGLNEGRILILLYTRLTVYVRVYVGYYGYICYKKHTL